MRQFSTTESPLKMMKNSFYFTFLFRSQDINIFYHDFFVIQKTWLTNNCKHILHNKSRSKGNQAMKFCQLIEYYIFIKKSYPKCGGETIPTPFSKKLKLGISMDQ